MNALNAIAGKLVTLFVDDLLFAGAIAGWLALIALATAFAAGPPALRAIALFAGLAIVLIASVARAASRAGSAR
jgi:membrane protein implicated in regulation of membrane protease activity